MDWNGPSVIVASYSPGTVLGALEGCLAEIASAVRAVEPDVLRTMAVHQDDVIVADFAMAPQRAWPASAVLFLQGQLVLGLFPSLDGPEVSRAVANCSEVALWPAERSELEAKLQRLRRLASPGVTLADELTVALDTVGDSPAFRKIFTSARKFARCDAPILIYGETGTGKEKVARAIHYLGTTSAGPFIAVNCGALPDTLVENELFGHEKGAYTDAGHARRGLVAQAEGGTLFLDEVETLSCRGQVALLRFLQDLEYRPLGAERSRQVRLRLITATNASLPALVEAGEFRQDLLYRLDILALEIPPLRVRGEDSVLLAEHFLGRYRKRFGQPDKYLSAASLEWVRRHDWPGNVRELENLLLREFLLADGACISLAPADALPTERRGGFDRRNRALYSDGLSDAKAKVLGEFERAYLEHVLEEARGNVSQAARRAGKDRRTFSKLMVKHGLNRLRYVPTHRVPPR
jgi:DNA-binding NtrC family response regulator